MPPPRTAAHYLAITALASNQLQLANDLTRCCLQSGCNILSSRMHSLGQEFGMTLLLAGSWSAIAKIEAALPTLQSNLGIRVLAQRTTERDNREKLMCYSVEILTIDRPGILHDLTDFFCKQQIGIEEISVSSYIAHTGTRMAALTMHILLAEHIQLAIFRDQFLNYCENHNLDAAMEPIRT